MDNETLARFFERLAPRYIDAPLEVELLEFWHVPPHAAPFWAAIVWDSGKWALLADVNDEPPTLWRRLFHELAHVRYGDVTKNGRGAELLRQAATGCMVTSRENIVAADVAKSTAAASARFREKAADVWAELEARDWWPVMSRVNGADIGAIDREIAKHWRQRQ